MIIVDFSDATDYIAEGNSNLVSGLKDLYDAVHLVREISERYINKKLSDRFGRHFHVDTYVIVPDYKEHWRLEEIVMAVRRDSNVEKRDAFSIIFWLRILYC